MKKLTFLASCTLLLITSSFFSSVIPSAQVPTEDNQVVVKEKEKAVDHTSFALLSSDMAH